MERFGGVKADVKGSEATVQANLVLTLAKKGKGKIKGRSYGVVRRGNI